MLSLPSIHPVANAPGRSYSRQWPVQIAMIDGCSAFVSTGWQPTRKVAQTVNAIRSRVQPCCASDVWVITRFTCCDGYQQTGGILRPFSQLVDEVNALSIAWVNIELTKDAAEIGYARFLYAVSAG